MDAESEISNLGKKRTIEEQQRTHPWEELLNVKTGRKCIDEDDEEDNQV